MPKHLELACVAASLIARTALLAARWAGAVRAAGMQAAINGAADERDKELLFLRERIRLLELQLGFFRKRLAATRPRYSVAERLQVLWAIEFFQIPKRRVKEHFGIARSTLYRWIHRVDGPQPNSSEPENKTPAKLADFVWRLAIANPHWGRFRISNQLALLGVFLAASTVRRILNRPMPPKAKTVTPGEQLATSEKRSPAIRATYPNHVWSVDHTIIRRWGLLTTYVFVIIDHFSRKVIAAVPLEGPNSAWTVEALEQCFREHGSPKHLISDHHPIFTGAPFTELLDAWSVKQRLGAVGKHGSIAVTERVIRTLKYEWLKRVPLIRGFDHLTELCQQFVEWHNDWRPHMTLGGLRPSDCYARDPAASPDRCDKAVPEHIEERVFRDTRTVGFRLRDAA